MNVGEIVPVKVPVGSGCSGCVYVDRTPGLIGNCKLKMAERYCSRTLYNAEYELIYTTPEKAALMRLRGQTHEKD
jgi:hypothetical protein